MLALPFGNVSRSTGIALSWLFLAALALRLFFAFQTPRYLDETEGSIRAFNDELSHLKYSLHLVKHRSLPVKEKLHDAEDPFRIEWDWTFYDFEFSQPPLFYILNIPAVVTPDPMIASRLFCVVLSAFTLYFAVLCCPLIFKQKDLASIVAMVGLGFYPVLVRIGSSVTPDNLAWMLSAILFYWYLRNPNLQDKYLWGIVIGVGILTKVSFLFWIIFLLVRSVAAQSNRTVLIKKTVIVTTLAVLISGWWFYRNWVVYQDPTGLIANSGRPGAYLISGSLYYYEGFVDSVISDSYFPIVEEDAQFLIVVKSLFIFLVAAFCLQISKWKTEFLSNQVFRDFVIANFITLLLFVYANLRYSLPEIRNSMIGFLPAACFAIAILMHNFRKTAVIICGAANLMYYIAVLG